MSVFDQISSVKMIPVVRTNTADQANRMIEILVRNGARIVEVTLTIPGAVGVIKNWSDKLLIGAGTVLSPQQATEAIAAGAKFCVAPGFDSETGKFCEKKNVPYIPGVLTPTEIVNVQAHGYKLVKVFPASAMGGEKYLNAISRVFPKMKWLATGGVNLENMQSLMKAGVILGVGESMMSNELMDKGDWEKVEAQVREYYNKLKG